jgi:hypothetical protein
MPRDNPTEPFYLIVTDHDCGVFAVEGPMTDDRPWNEARHSPGTISAASSVARPAPIAKRWQPTIGTRIGWPACRPAAS